MCVNPENRATATEALEDPWLLVTNLPFRLIIVGHAEFNPVVVDGVGLLSIPVSLGGKQKSCLFGLAPITNVDRRRELDEQ